MRYVRFLTSGTRMSRYVRFLTSGTRMSREAQTLGVEEVAAICAASAYLITSHSPSDARRTRMCVPGCT